MHSVEYTLTLQGTLYNTFDEVPDKHRERLHRHLFPPDEHSVQAMHLDRWCVFCFICACVGFYSMRILPHHGDTGGFFLAVIEKIAELPFARPANGVELSLC
jgi:hypothetical protein